MERSVTQSALVSLEAEASLWPPKEEGGVLKASQLQKGKLRPSRAMSHTL